jgi:hypothetical protein
MESRSVDRWSRALAHPKSRRGLLARLGIGSAAVAASAAGRFPVAAVASEPLVCEIDLVGHVRLGPTFDLPVEDADHQGRVTGIVSFEIGDGGSIARATLDLDDGRSLEGIGQMDNRLLTLRLGESGGDFVILSGIAVAQIRTCEGPIDGTMRGPLDGDLGDWTGTLSRFEPETESMADDCPAGQTSCAGVCVDLSTSETDCGACGNACTGGGVCNDGVCACAYGPGTCRAGYVWREAVPGDNVCVTGSSRSQAASDNASAASRVNPNCVYGVDACKTGYVWREAGPGDHVCVDGAVRAQVIADNAAAASRVDPGGAYGPNSCVAGYVWREAFSGDYVCVTGAVRTQAANDNAAAAGRVDPTCVYGVNACVMGYVWRGATSTDYVCVEGWVRDQTAIENADAGSTVDPLCLT